MRRWPREPILVSFQNYYAYNKIKYPEEMPRYIEFLFQFHTTREWNEMGRWVVESYSIYAIPTVIPFCNVTQGHKFIPVDSREELKVIYLPRLSNLASFFDWKWPSKSGSIYGRPYRNLIPAVQKLIFSHSIRNTNHNFINYLSLLPLS